MSDDLDDLKRVLDRATPAPDAARRRIALDAALENFDRLQGSDLGARPTVRPGIGTRLMQGVRAMFETMTTKAALAATTATAALAVVVLVPVWQEVGPGVQVPAGGSVVETVDGPVRVDDFAIGETGEDEEAILLSDLADLRAQKDALERSRWEHRQVDGAAPADAVSRAGAEMVEEEFATEADTVPSVEVSNMGRMGIKAPPLSEPVIQMPEADTEAFANADESALKVTTEAPVSTFSIDVDTASYAVVRSSLNAGRMPPKDAVRIEEMVNYFPYDYAAPEGDAAFSHAVSVFPTPWNAATQLVRIGIQGQMVEARPPLNLVFLIDTSGSMHDRDKLPLLVQSFRLMLGELRPEDKVAIVTYAGSAGRVLEPTAASERATIEAALSRLTAGGSTAGAAGIAAAYATAEGMAEDGAVTRVVLATDGDFNVGVSDPAALEDLIAKKREGGVYLSVLGFGRGNLDDATMQALAQNGNGTASYIDTLSEARKVLVDQLSGALVPIADDVKIQVEFNPAEVAEWRLIGYETRALAREDFDNDRVDAGEIGAGHQVTALYEVTPVGSDAVRHGPLRYQPAADVSDASDELGFLRLRYKAPGAATSRLIETPIASGVGAADADARFAAAVAGFGQLLRDGRYLGDWGYADAIALASGAKGADTFGYRAGAVDLMRLAEALDR